MGDHSVSIPRSRFLCYWLPPLLWGLVVLGLSGEWGSDTTSLGMLGWLLSWVTTWSPAQLLEINFYARKAAHVTVYAILYVLWHRAFQEQQRYSRSGAFLISMVLCLTFGLMDEGHQLLVNSRTGSIRDVGLDLAGSSLGALLTFALWPARSKVAPVER